MTQTIVNVPEAGGAMGEGTFYQEGSVSGALTIDFANGYYQELTLTGNVTSLAFTNGPADGEGKSVVVDFVQDGTGSRTVTFSSVKFDSGIAPTLSTGAGDIDRIAFDITNDGSDQIYGHVLGLDMQ
tara:strand:- start:1378 stop:1758 length:381 start_codon:yes stop_codon:yes gene_type:complete